MADLDERKRTILKAIIQTYLDTGEPVGSRTISKYTDLHLSSATIRNEMSDLEEMGYIVQPHTSAGRIPSDKGYRFYFDELIRRTSTMMDEKNKEVDQAKELMIQKTDRLEKVLKQVVEILANNTNYATMITGPAYHTNRIKFIQLSRVSENQMLAVIVTQGNLVKNRIINISDPIDDEQTLKLNLLLNTEMNGLSIGEINLEMITKMKREAGIHSKVIADVVDAVAEAIQPDEDDYTPIYTSGTTNIFDYPELADSEKAKKLISTFEDKKELAEIMTETGEREQADGKGTEIRAYIGSESPLAGMQDCSVVTTSYDLGNGMKGNIAIVGPRRMDYKKVVDNLKNLKDQLDFVFGDKKEEGGDRKGPSEKGAPPGTDSDADP